MKNLCLPLILIILLNACSRFESSIDIEPFLLKGTDEFFYHSTTGLVLTKVMQGPQLTSVNSEGSTHYAIKFYPKSTRELFRLIRAENVLTSYYPFGYEPTNLSESEDAFVVDDFELNPLKAIEKIILERSVLFISTPYMSELTTIRSLRMSP